MAAVSGSGTAEHDCYAAQLRRYRRRNKDKNPGAKPLVDNKDGNEVMHCVPDRASCASIMGVKHIETGSHSCGRNSLPEERAALAEK